MTVPLRMWQLLSLTVYSVVAAGASLYAGWSLPMTLVLLLGVPIVLLWYESRLPLARLSVGIGMGALLLLLLEVVAHMTGAWYTVTASSWRVFGLSVEAVLFAVAHVFFYLVLYEYVFDDNRVAPKVWQRYKAFIALVATLLVTTFYLFAVWVVTFAFSWVIGLLLLVVLLLLLLSHRGDTRRLIEKAGFFAILLFPLSLTHELVAVEAGVRVFAFVSEYIGTVTLGEQVVPVEELLLLLLWPMLLIILYECLVDDGQ